MSYAYRRRKKLIKRAKKVHYKYVWERGGKLKEMLSTYESSIDINK